MNRVWLWLSVGLLLVACTSAPAIQPPTALPTLWPVPSATPSPARTIQPPTPIIIATPTSSPTPVTYVVQKGETLLGIAIKLGVSLEALQAANPTIDPRFLSIGMALLVPIGEGTPSPNLNPDNLPQPTPLPVTVGVPTCLLLVSGGLYCLADVHNSTMGSIENITVRFTLADATGLPIATGAGEAALSLLKPEAYSPVGVLFVPAPIGVAAIEAQVIAALPGAVERTVALDIVDPQVTHIGPEWQASGQILNATALTATTARVTLTLYDATGAVRSFRQIEIGPVAAGVAVNFSLSATASSGTVAQYRIAVEGWP